MATYVIGDVQGCFGALMRLVERIDFQKGRDEIWLAGDLVNRGPDSLSVLRWAMRHESSVVSVLGNHDLHLLATAAGLRPASRGTLTPILEAEDRDELLRWLLHRPVLHRSGRWVVVHAGLLPQWSWREAFERAEEAERWLRRKGMRAAALQDTRKSVAEKVRDPDHPRHTLRVMTHIRTCTPKGRLGDHKGPPRLSPQGYAPWYAHPTPRGGRWGVAFGHWAAHGLWVTREHIALDTGCVWGGQLTAVRLEDLAVTQVSAGG